MLAPSHTALGPKEAWSLLLALARRQREGRPPADGARLALDADGRLVDGAANAWIVARANAPRGWSAGSAPSTAEFDEMLDLYGPLALGARGALVVAHLAQTLDGRIALASGRSQFISGQENLVHAHRLRALCDVVVVGRGTVEHDDPLLTTRLCPGESPVRAVIDPARKLGEDRRVFSGRDAPTLVLCDEASAKARPAHGLAEAVGVAAEDGVLPAAAVLSALRARGLRRVFVEGGGVTVSRFLQAGAIDRLHVTVAPYAFGCGVPSITLPEISDMSAAIALAWRPFTLGRDVLFDCTVRA